MSARILLVEDNPANLKLMGYLLTQSGHSVLTATDGEAALETAHREKPDLIISDVHLPKIDGCEVARRLKADPDLRGIPLVAVTALAMVGDRAHVMAAGFDDYIAKPIDPHSIVADVEKHLAVRKTSLVPSRAETMGRNRQFAKRMPLVCARLRNGGTGK